MSFRRRYVDRTSQYIEDLQVRDAIRERRADAIRRIAITAGGWAAIMTCSTAALLWRAFTGECR